MIEMFNKGNALFEEYNVYKYVQVHILWKLVVSNYCIKNVNILYKNLIVCQNLKCIKINSNLSSNESEANLFYTRIL